MMEQTQALRTPEFLDGLDDPEFVERFLTRRSPLGLDDAHRGARPRRLGVLGHVLERSCSGVIVPGTGDSPQQHARRAGPQPARLPPPSAGPTNAEHDVADGRAPGGRAGARARQRGLEPDPLGDPPDDHPRGRRRPRGRRGGAGAARPFRGRCRVRRAGHRHRARSSAPAGRSARFRELNLFFGGVQAAARDEHGRFSGGGDPRRGGAAIVVQDG